MTLRVREGNGNSVYHALPHPFRLFSVGNSCELHIPFRLDHTREYVEKIPMFQSLASYTSFLDSVGVSAISLSYGSFKLLRASYVFSTILGQVTGSSDLPLFQTLASITGLFDWATSRRQESSSIVSNSCKHHRSFRHVFQDS